MPLILCKTIKKQTQYPQKLSLGHHGTHHQMPPNQVTMFLLPCTSQTLPLHDPSHRIQENATTMSHHRGPPIIVTIPPQPLSSNQSSNPESRPLPKQHPLKYPYQPRPADKRTRIHRNKDYTPPTIVKPSTQTRTPNPESYRHWMQYGNAGSNPRQSERRSADSRTWSRSRRWEATIR